MDQKGIPLGLGFALAQNTRAMERFSAMTEAGRAQVLQRAHAVSSKEEMQMLVNELAGGEVF